MCGGELGLLADATGDVVSWHRRPLLGGRGRHGKLVGAVHAAGRPRTARPRPRGERRGIPCIVDAGGDAARVARQVGTRAGGPVVANLARHAVGDVRRVVADGRRPGVDAVETGSSINVKRRHGGRVLGPAVARVDRGIVGRIA